MPHLRVDRTSRIEPPSPSPSSTLQNGHPIYSLRRLHIITAAFGNLLFLFCFDHYPFVRITIYFLFGSIFFTMCDLLAYAQAPSPQTHCQKKWILLGDIVWAAILQLGFWGSVVDLQWGGPSVLIMVAVTTGGVCSLLHLVAFYKQLRAFYRAKWQVDSAKTPCGRCGFADDGREKVFPCRQSPNITTYVGPSAYCHQAGILKPGSRERVMEEGLLESSDFGSEQFVSDVEAAAEIEEVGNGQEKETGRGCW